MCFHNISSYLVTMTKRFELQKGLSSLSFTSSALGGGALSAGIRLSWIEKNPLRRSIDPAHYFTQSSTFTIKMLAGILSLLLIWALTQSSREKPMPMALLIIFSLPSGHIINVIICKEGLLNALLYKWRWKSWTLTLLSLKMTLTPGTVLP